MGVIRSYMSPCLLREQVCYTYFSVDHLISVVMSSALRISHFKQIKNVPGPLPSPEPSRTKAPPACGMQWPAESFAEYCRE